jgi:hypothetical protein
MTAYLFCLQVEVHVKIKEVGLHSGALPLAMEA